MKTGNYIMAWIVAGMAGTSAAQEVVVDFRNRIPGVLDVPMFDTDGITPLSGGSFMAQLFFSTNGAGSLVPAWASPFQTGTNAGYWEPKEVVLPWGNLGQTFTFQLRVWEHVPVFPFGEIGIGGVSPTWSQVLTQNLSTLTGLQSLKLQPESLRIVSGQDQVRVYWPNLGASRYELQSTADLGSAAPWDVLFVPTEYSVAFGAEFTVTNVIDSPRRFYRLQRWR